MADEDDLGWHGVSSHDAGVDGRRLGSVRWLTVLAQEAPGGLPDDVGSGIIWGIFLAVIGALYVLVRNTRRRADRQYWDRRRREKELRDADPDMRKDEES